MKEAFLAAALTGAGLMPSPDGARVLRLPAPAEEAAPDAFDSDDAFRRALLDSARSDRWLVPTTLGGILLVVEKGYLDAAGVDRLCAELQEAVEAVPRLTGRSPRVTGRFTVYAYDEGPISEAGVPGVRPGEKGLMLRFAKESADPLFHEMTHLLAGYGGSQSLNEGIASWVQTRLRPGRAASFAWAGLDPHREAARALAAYPPAFRDAVGVPGYHVWSGPTVRFDFYFSSWSFVDFLLGRGGMEQLWAVVDGGGAPEAYRAAYGLSRDELVSAWMRGLAEPAAAEPSAGLAGAAERLRTAGAQAD